MTEKGARMASSIADFIFMRHFFPKMRDRKKFNRAKHDFFTDMKFDLGKGTIQTATLRCTQKKYLVSLIMIWTVIIGNDRRHL
jgi:hypothetical protein